MTANRHNLVGREFRHFKGNLYRLEGFARDSETLEEMVVYRALGPYPVVPPKTEYALTDLGKATVPIVHEMDKWGADFFAQLGVPIPCDET